MNRLDFLVTVMFSVMLLDRFLKGEMWVAYLAFFMLPMFALLAWVLSIHIRMLKRENKNG